MANVTKVTEQYIREHPSVKDCLQKGLVNHSALARRLSTELALPLKKNFDAMVIASRRFARKLVKEKEYEKEILEVLKKSKIEVKNKMCAVVLERDVFFSNLLALEKEIRKKNETIRIIEGVSGITIITSEDFLELIKKYFKNKIIIENTCLAEITIKSPPEIETTPGAYAYLCSLFGEYNINIVETMSCWTDTIFLVNEEDIGKGMRMLRF